MSDLAKQRIPRNFMTSRLKIERANQHIRDTQTRIEDFLRFEYQSPFVDKEPESGNLRLNFWHPGEFAFNGFGVIVGDVVHNLRCALDHTVTEIVRILGKNTNDRAVVFPMHETREELVKSVNRGLEKKIGADLCGFIINTIKPYKAGNYPLWALNKLDNIDKHRSIIFADYSIETGIYFVEHNATGPFPRNHICVLTDGSPVPKETMAYLHNQTYAQAAVEIQFKERSIFENKPVIPTLLQLAELVSGVVETLSAHFLASRI